MSSRHVVVIVNGTLQYPQRLLQVLDGADAVVAADGGANWLAAQGRVPDLLIGDLDSADPEVIASLDGQGVAIERHSPRKDETDTELALLRAVEMGAARITMLGALGGRIDHEIANISLLAMPALSGIETSIYDGISFISLLRGKGTILGQGGDTVSLIPWGGDAVGIVTEGLEYPLRGETLYIGPARGISNVMTGTAARVTVERGALLIVRTPQGTLEALDG